MLLTSNRNVDEWEEVATAVFDRQLHESHVG